MNILQIHFSVSNFSVDFLFLNFRSRNHGQGSRPLLWHWQKSSRFDLHLFLLLMVDFIVLFFRFCFLIGIVYLFFGGTRSSVQGLQQWPEVYTHHLLTHWSCKFFFPFFVILLCGSDFIVVIIFSRAVVMGWFVFSELSSTLFFSWILRDIALFFTRFFVMLKLYMYFYLFQ